MNRHNYALKVELKKQVNIAAGLVSDRFPGVSDIVIHMTYYGEKVTSVLMERTVNIFPTSYANFKIDCMTKGCDRGGFDLNSAIAKMVKTNKRVSRGAIVCHGNIATFANKHASIEYKAVIRYKKASK